MDLAFVLTLTLGLALGALLGWIVARGAAARLRAELHTARAVHQERLQAYQDSDARLRDTFSALSKSALAANSEEFLKLAETRLSQARSEGAADIDARRTAIAELLAPMKTTLDKVEREISESEHRRSAAGAALLEKIASLDVVGQNLRDETRRLTDALKRPGVRGRWGELQLKRVVELAGMVEHCHFTEQQTIQSEDGRVRPDVVIQLPGGKQVIVDAKVPLDAYLRALEAPDEDARLRLLADHARQVRNHMGQLSAKSYFGKLAVTPEFVVMFLPGELFFSAALEQDPALIEFGVDKRVIPASPTTLIALLRAVAYGWQQEAVARDAQQIAETGRRLYDAVGKLAEHFEKLGQKLRGSIDAYNDAIGSLEGNVLVKARRFKDLQTANGSEEIKIIEPVDRVPRRLQASELTGGLPFHDGDEAGGGDEDTEEEADAIEAGRV